MTSIKKRISFSRSFKKEYQKLPQEIQENLNQKLKFLSEDPQHPSLRLKKMGGTVYWEISITMNYRLILRFDGEEIKLITVGTHDILKKV